MLVRPTHVIFDLDGTLLDSEPIYTLAAQAVVGRFGKVYDWSIKKQVAGGDPWRGAERVVELLQLPITPAQYLQEREVHMRELCKQVPAMPGAQALVEGLAARGIPMAIGTSSQRELAVLKLSSQPWAALIPHLVCSDDPDVSGGKPSPDIFRKAARLMGAQPASCLVFEDTPTGVLAAHNAGMPVIAVVVPEMRDADFSRALAVLSSLQDLSWNALGL